MSELPAGVAPADPPAPRPSASAIVLRREPGIGWNPLLVVRSRKSRFMPGNLAFPGGVFEDCDGSIDDPAAWQRCAERELWEETGLRHAGARWFAARERTTPPLFPMRFRTLFFVAEAPDDYLPPTELPSPEVEGFRWSRAGEIVAEWEAGDALVPPPVLSLLRTLADCGDVPLGDIAARIGAANDQEQRAPRIEFARDIWMLPVRTATLPPASHTNVWIPGGRRFVVIDPGCTDRDEQGRICEVVQRRKDLGHRLEAVVLTHHHGDHTAGALAVAERLEVPLRGHVSVLSGFGAESPAVERIPIENGEVLDLDGVTLRAIWTPGHASGHFAYQVAERRTLIAGDLISGMSTILIDPVHGDMQAYLESLERVDALGCRTLLPGHGPPLPGKAVGKLIEHRTAREEKVLRQLENGPADLETIAKGAYPELPHVPVALTGPQALSHLIWLERKGLAARTDPDGRSWTPNSNERIETEEP